MKALAPRNLHSLRRDDLVHFYHWIDKRPGMSWKPSPPPSLTIFLIQLHTDGPWHHIAHNPTSKSIVVPDAALSTVRSFWDDMIAEGVVAAFRSRKPVASGTSQVVVLTASLIHAGQTGPGGFKKSQLALLGVSWPPQRGWLSRLIGSTLEVGKYKLFLELANGNKSDQRELF